MKMKIFVAGVVVGWVACNKLLVSQRYDLRVWLIGKYNLDCGGPADKVISSILL